MALKGKMDFIKKTNPFGSESDPDEEFEKNRVDDPEIAAKQLLAFVDRRQGNTARHGTKRRSKKV